MRNYWRVEQSPLHLYAYALVEGAYHLAAESAEQITVSSPFQLTLPIAQLSY